MLGLPFKLFTKYFVSEISVNDVLRKWFDL
jgi:hypothetical protein